MSSQALIFRVYAPCCDGAVMKGNGHVHKCQHCFVTGNHEIAAMETNSMRDAFHHAHALTRANMAARVTVEHPDDPEQKVLEIAAFRKCPICTLAYPTDLFEGNAQCANCHRLAAFDCSCQDDIDRVMPEEVIEE